MAALGQEYLKEKAVMHMDEDQPAPPIDTGQVDMLRLLLVDDICGWPGAVRPATRT